MQKNLAIFFCLIGLSISTNLWAQNLTVALTGLSSELETHVKSYLDIFRVQSDSEITSSKIEGAHEKAEKQILQAVQVFGFYKANVISTLISKNGDWFAEYRVNLGEAIKYEKVDIQITGAGINHPELLQLTENFPLKKDSDVNHSKYDSARDGLLRKAIELGYLDARYSNRQLIINIDKYIASVELVLDTGVQYFFGESKFYQDAMDEEFLRKYIRFSQGDIYRPSVLLNLQRQLSDSGYFRKVEIAPDRNNKTEDNQIPVKIILEARDRNEWRFGLGYATDTGARGSINHTRIIGDEGHRYIGNLLVAEKKNSLLLGYTIPLDDPTTDQLGFSISYTDEITDTRESQISAVTASNTSTWGQWQRVVSLNYEQETYIVGNQPQDTKDILFPALSVNRVKADDRLHTRKGYRIYSEIRGANENLLSDTNFGQLRLGMKWIHSLGNDSRMLLRGDLGVTNVGDINKLPASQRFFAGGDNSVRGYAFETLGPKDETGEVIGGKHLIVGSVEFDHRVSEKWNAAIFYDIGNAVNSVNDDLFAGTGVGLRWKSPVGPVRFDFAWALDKTEDQFRLHVVIGPDL